MAAEEERQLEAAAQNEASVAADIRAKEPRVATTPFQATRLARAFDVFPERAAKVTLWTRLNVDLTRESVRGTCHLPHGLQTSVRVLAFCDDRDRDEMLAAGADVAGITEPIRKISQGWLEFDRCLATPSIMPQVMKVARVLGPRKMMPNPKSGTVVANLKQAIKESKGGTLLEYRAEGAGEIRAEIADATFPDARILENLKFLISTLLRARPRGSGRDTAAPMIATKAASGAQQAKDEYFLDAYLQLGSKGPPIYVFPESLMPTSTGYFR